MISAIMRSCSSRIGRHDRMNASSAGWSGDEADQTGGGIASYYDRDGSSELPLVPDRGASHEFGAAYHRHLRKVPRGALEWNGQIVRHCTLQLPGASRVVMTRLHQAVLRASCGVLRAVGPNWTRQSKSRLVLMPCGGKHPQRRAFVLLHHRRSCLPMKR